MTAVKGWLPVLLRTIVVWLLAPSAIFKFAGYEAAAEGFAALGIPAPGLMVLVVGTFEMVAVVALVLGLAGRLASVPVVGIMVVAMLTAGVSPSNVAVLLGSLGIILLGTGKLSLWKPEEGLLARA